MDLGWWHLPALIALIGVSVAASFAWAALRADRCRRKRSRSDRPRALRGISKVNDPARRYEAESGRAQEDEASEGGDACPGGRWGILRDGAAVERYASTEMARRRFRALIASQADAPHEDMPAPVAGRKSRSVVFTIPPR
jgi:hypothetical protein